MEQESSPSWKPFSFPIHSNDKLPQRPPKPSRPSRLPRHIRKAKLKYLEMDLQKMCKQSTDNAWGSEENNSILREEMHENVSKMHPELAKNHMKKNINDKVEKILELETSLLETEKVKQILEEKKSNLDQNTADYVQLIKVKDQTILSLSIQLHELEIAGKVSVGTQCESDKEEEALQDTATAFLLQNKFLNKEVLELNKFRQQAIDREQKLFFKAGDWEAKFYQTQSKYLLLLMDLHNPVVLTPEKKPSMARHHFQDIVELSEKPSLSSHNPKYDKFGFELVEDCCLNNWVERERRPSKEIGAETTHSLEEAQSQWDGIVSRLSKPVHFIMTLDTKNLLRRGVPINQRGAVWKAIVDNRMRRRPKPGYYQALLMNCNPALALSPAAKQVEMDLLRTFPNNKHYNSSLASGIPKLRRVLLAYSLHNPEIEYCQGFNRIAAIALLFLNEEDAFWCLVYIVEVVMPQSYYCKQLIGAQIDQEVFKELVREKLPSLCIHLENHGVDLALFSLNWFLCLFVDTLPTVTYLHIWDALLFEGSKVLFRYGLAILQSIQEKLLKQKDYLSILSTFRAEVECLCDVEKLTKIAFHDLNPFPLRSISKKREHYQKILEAEMERLKGLRIDLRKNSLASKTSSPCYVESDKYDGMHSSNDDNYEDVQ